MITGICVVGPIIGIVAEKVVISRVFVFSLLVVPVLGILVVVSAVIPGIGILVRGSDTLRATATGERRRSRATRPIVA